MGKCRETRYDIVVDVGRCLGTSVCTNIDPRNNYYTKNGAKKERIKKGLDIDSCGVQVQCKRQKYS